MTNNSGIGQLIKSLRQYLRDKPQNAVTPDHEAVAVLDEGLRCHMTYGDTVVATDMSTGIGGGDSAPTPGWYMRAAVASCFATSIALRAAELDIEIEHLEVRVGSTTDSRGLLGFENHTVGMLGVEMEVQIDADAPEEIVAEIIQYADAHSPVSATILDKTPIRLTVAASST